MITPIQICHLMRKKDFLKLQTNLEILPTEKLNTQKVLYSGSVIYTVTFHIPENSQQNLLCKFFPYKQLNDVYYTFHTQDPEWCIRNLLEINKLNEYVFDNNFRLKQVIKEKGNY